MTSPVPFRSSAGGVRTSSPGAVLLAALLAALPTPARAQESQPRITVREVSTSADTVLLGDRFSLRVAFHLSAGSVAFLPDSLLGRGFEPFGPVTWERTEQADGGADVVATYPLIAFEVGDVEIPEFGSGGERGVVHQYAGNDCHPEDHCWILSTDLMVQPCYRPDAGCVHFR